MNAYLLPDDILLLSDLNKKIKSTVIHSDTVFMFTLAGGKAQIRPHLAAVGLGTSPFGHHDNTLHVVS